MWLVKQGIEDNQHCVENSSCGTNYRKKIFQPNLKADSCMGSISKCCQSQNCWFDNTNLGSLSAKEVY